jgi:hypothetical protein
MPFENNTQNTFGWQSAPQDNPYVQAYQNTPVEIDPGSRQRTDLAEQQSQNRWNSAFAMGIPEQVRMMMQGSEQRQIAQQGADEQQQAKYRQNALELQKKERLLPQLTQTGGKSSGFNSVYSQPGFFGRLGNSFADSLGNTLGSI